MNEQQMLQNALIEWRRINSIPDRWASFEAVRFNTETRCAIKWGVKHFGRKEQPLQTIVWTFYHGSQKCDSGVKLTHY